MDTELAQKLLRSMGWRLAVDGQFGPQTSLVVTDFQRGWHLGDPLLVDGKIGPKTRHALKVTLARRHQGLPDFSANFSAAEFACKCGGRYANCRRIRVHRDVVANLEHLRVLKGGPIEVISGYRCPAHNQKVGGASSSQHLYGAAVDIEYHPNLSYLAVRRMRRFAGIGKSARTSLVRHVDNRNVSGNNTTGGTPDRPTVWNYAS